MIKLIKKEPVLLASAVLAFITSFLNIPNMETVKAIDFRVLSILFCLMTVTSGLDEEGMLSFLAQKMLSKTKKWRMVYILLVMMCFFSSMLLTNDVALIAFVPFAIKTVHMIGKEDRLIKLIVMQTIAANLGSMLTPIGNPQNLYLYSLMGIGMFEFMVNIMPLWIISLIFIFITAFTEKNDDISERKHENISSINKQKTIMYIFLFIVSVSCVMHIIHFLVSFTVVMVVILIGNKKLFRKTDYTLILTFIFFFIFIHNIKSINIVNEFFKSAVYSREFLSGFILSQVISNVPAAILLSGFTDNYMALTFGVNVGGLGTLIASMASLISYKFYSATKEADIKKFMFSFTKWNIVFIILILPISFLLIN